jgi:hypothetical protein
MTQLERTFDWRSRHDERSRNYSVEQLLETKGKWSRKAWRAPGERLDQGREGACVGFALTNELLSSPSPMGRVIPKPRNKFASDVYREAQKIDEWPGEDYEGTSILAGMKVLRSRGLISSYYWAFGIEQVLDTLVSVGPVVIGIPWHESMYNTDENGLVRIDGREVGGHAILLTGYHPNHPVLKEPVVRWRNSWGPEYGINGNGFIRPSNLSWLLQKYGEACIPVY